MVTLRARNVRKLHEVSHKRADLRLAQVEKWRHVLAALMQSYEQGLSGLLRHLVRAGRTHVHSNLLHPLHDERNRGSAHGIDDRIDFRRSAESGFAMTSLAIQAI